MSKHPDFRVSSATSGASFVLSNGGKLTVMRGPDGVFIGGELGEVKKNIAISDEAADVLMAALMLSRRDNTKPVPYALLFALKDGKAAELSRTDSP